MFLFIIKPNIDAFILTAACVIARIRTVNPVRLGVATLIILHPPPPPPKPYLLFSHLQFSSRFILDVWQSPLNLVESFVIFCSAAKDKMWKTFNLVGRYSLSSDATSQKRQY